MKGVFVLAVLVCCVAVISAEHFYVDREIESVELESVLRAPVPGQVSDLLFVMNDTLPSQHQS